MERENLYFHLMKKQDPDMLNDLLLARDVIARLPHEDSDLSDISGQHPFADFLTDAFTDLSALAHRNKLSAETPGRDLATHAAATLNDAATMLVELGAQPLTDLLPLTETERETGEIVEQRSQTAKELGQKLAGHSAALRSMIGKGPLPGARPGVSAQQQLTL